MYVFIMNYEREILLHKNMVATAEALAEVL